MPQRMKEQLDNIEKLHSIGRGIVSNRHGDPHIPGEENSKQSNKHQRDTLSHDGMDLLPDSIVKGISKEQRNQEGESY